MFHGAAIRCFGHILNTLFPGARNSHIWGAWMNHLYEPANVWFPPSHGPTRPSQNPRPPKNGGGVSERIGVSPRYAA